MVSREARVVDVARHRNHDEEGIRYDRCHLARLGPRVHRGQRARSSREEVRCLAFRVDLSILTRPTRRFYIRALPSTVESETYNFDDRFAPSRSPEVDLDEKDVVDPANAAPQAAAQDYRSDEEPATTDEEGGFAEIEPETEDDESFMMDDKPLAEEVAPVKSGVSQLTVEATTGMEVDPKSVTDAKPGAFS